MHTRIALAAVFNSYAESLSKKWFACLSARRDRFLENDARMTNSGVRIAAAAAFSKQRSA
jgi:hypothetical protein